MKKKENYFLKTQIVYIRRPSEKITMIFLS